MRLRLGKLGNYDMRSTKLYSLVTHTSFLFFCVHHFKGCLWMDDRQEFMSVSA